MTKRELIQVRDDSYRDTLPEKRCETCVHYWPLPSACRGIIVRGEVVKKVVRWYGVCDLWEEQQ